MLLNWDYGLAGRCFSEVRGVFIGFVALLSFVNLILPREERGLEAAFGQAYLQYKHRVPRWLGKNQTLRLT